jgi:hypothetical protein
VVTTKTSDVTKEYRVSGLPTVYLINPKGQIHLAFSGFSLLKEGELVSILDKELLNGK